MLIQEIRARQALHEAGRTADVVIDHATPKTTIDGKEYTLVFPKFFFETNIPPKTVDKLFIGNVTESRMRFLAGFPDSSVEWSTRGRDDATKFFDAAYFDMMARAKFVLCPNGDFVWTYRFFEACIFGAIPIVEDTCDAYNGYHYYMSGDEYEYRRDWVAKNYYKALQELTL